MTRGLRALGGGALIAMLGVVALAGATENAAAGGERQPGGLVRTTDAASPGYTLFAPLEMKRTYLVDNDGAVVHTWQHDTQPGLYQYLLEDGTLVRAGRLKIKGPFASGKGQGGRVEAVDWDGTVLWRFDYANAEHYQHHDIEPLPNGHVLLLAWERKSAEEAIAAGRDPELLRDGEIWADTVVEYDPVSDAVVWKWSAWDHLVQDHDATKANDGDVATTPRKIDLNYAVVGHGEADWTHANAVDYNPELDQIVISLRSNSEVWVIDHATTTEAAAGPAGDLLFRYGNPAVLAHDGPQTLFTQHDAEWVPAGDTDAGKILLFNNGTRGRREYSSADLVVPETGPDGEYVVGDDGLFGADLERVYPKRKADRAFAPIISGAQRLTNGNTLLTYGTTGRILEVTPEGDAAWEYKNPYYVVRKDTPKRSGSGFVIEPFWMFRADRYAPDYPGLAELEG